MSGIDERGLGKEGTVSVILTIGQANDNPPHCAGIMKDTTFVMDEDTNTAAVDLLDFSVCDDLDGTTIGAALTSGADFTLTGASVLQLNANSCKLS